LPAHPARSQHPQDLAAGPAQATTRALPRAFWIYAGGVASELAAVSLILIIRKQARPAG